MDYKNGSWWTKDNAMVMLQELSPSLFCLMAFVDGAFQLVYDQKHKGKWQYSFEEVPELLEGWTQDKKHLFFVDTANERASTHAVSEGGVETKQFVTATGGIEEVAIPKETRKRRKGAEVTNGIDT